MVGRVFDTAARAQQNDPGGEYHVQIQQGFRDQRHLTQVRSPPYVQEEVRGVGEAEPDSAEIQGDLERRINGKREQCTRQIQKRQQQPNPVDVHRALAF